MGRSGSGSVGKGGRDANYAPPVDQYRRRIARQDSRKEKSHMKEVKHAQETKDVAPKAVKQIVVTLLTILMVFTLVYGILFYAIGGKDSLFQQSKKREEE